MNYFIVDTFLSHINYASTVWDGCSEVRLKKLNSLHRRSAKLIHSDSLIPKDDKLKTLKLLPLEKQLKYDKAVMTFKVTSGKIPHYIHSLIARSTSRSASNNYIPLRPRIDLYKTSLAFSGVSTWNSLPPSLKNRRSIKMLQKTPISTP